MFEILSFLTTFSLRSLDCHSCDKTVCNVVISLLWDNHCWQCLWWLSMVTSTVKHLVRVSSCLSLQILWGLDQRHQEESTVLRQRLLRCFKYPGALSHPLYLPGHCHQCHHFWGIAWGCYREHAGEQELSEPTNTAFAFCCPVRAVFGHWQSWNSWYNHGGVLCFHCFLCCCGCPLTNCTAVPLNDN